MLTGNDIEAALQAVGELLQADGQPMSIVILGGAALNLLGIVSRTTRDVDIVAVTETPGDRAHLARPPKPLPGPLQKAIDQVARDFDLPPNWLNRGPAGQWDVGLPPGFADRLEWRTYAGLDVGIADRVDLILFKLEAAADQPDSDSRHFDDLVHLDPTDEELRRAAEWAREKNVGAEYHSIIERVVAHVTRIRKQRST